MRSLTVIEELSDDFKHIVGCQLFEPFLLELNLFVGIFMQDQFSEVGCMDYRDKHITFIYEYMFRHITITL